MQIYDVSFLNYIRMFQTLETVAFDANKSLYLFEYTDVYPYLAVS